MHFKQSGILCGRHPPRRCSKTYSPTAAVIALILVVNAYVPAAAGAPLLPTRFHGAVELSSANVPANAEIAALINGVQYSLARLTLDDGVAVYLLDVSADDLDTPAIEGGRDGDIITFQVNGFPADQTATWRSGGYTELNLTATPPPTAPVAMDQSVVTAEDIPVALTLPASDVNSDPLTYSLVTSPTHGTLAGTAPDLVYRPNADYSGTDSFTFTANDGTSDSNLATVAITVNPAADAPRLTPLDTQIVAEGATLDITISANDPDGDAIALSVTGMPRFASFTDHGDGTGNLTLRPRFGDAGVYIGVEATASDGALHNSAFLAIRVNPSPLPNLAINGFTASSFSPPRGAAVTLTADVCNNGEAPAKNVAVRFSLGHPAQGGTPVGADATIAQVAPGACGLANGTFTTGSVTGSQLLFAWIDPGDAIAEFDETDNLGTITVNVQPAIANLPPTITSTPVTSAQAEALYTYDVNATDRDGDSLTYALLTGTWGMTIDARSGPLRWQPRSFDVGNHPVKVGVSDGRGGAVQQAFTLTVAPSNYPPTITSAPVLDAVLRTQYIYQVTATDVDGDAVEYYLLQSPTGMSINHQSGAVRWIPVEGQEGLHNVVVQARDVRRAEARQTFAVRILSSADRPDLVVTFVDNRPTETDTQALSVGGTVSVTIGNAGATAAQGSIAILLFHDNGSGTYDSGADIVLGQATVTGGLAPGQTRAVSIPVSGVMDFRDDLIHAFVDSGNTVVEGDETNNVGQSGQASQFHPVPGLFTPELEWAWTGSDIDPVRTDVMMTPIVVNLTDDNGDGAIDRNDTPDIVFVATDPSLNDGGILRAVSGKDGSRIWDITDPELRIQPFNEIAAGDLDHDGKVEIVAVNGNQYVDSPPSPYVRRLLIFEHDGSLKQAGDDVGTDSGRISIIDMENDGSPEIAIGRAVYETNGTRRYRGSLCFMASAAICTGLNAAPASSVVDLDLDGKAELVTGPVGYRSDGSIFYNVSVNNQSPWGAGQECRGGLTAFGNFDSNPYAEIVVAEGRVVLLSHTGQTIWTWTPTAGEPGAVAAPTVADFDGDGLAEIGVLTAGVRCEDGGGFPAGYYTVLDGDGTTLWRRSVTDYSSGYTGSTVYDFEGDGAAEVVYADEEYLRVFRGSDGAVLFQVPNPSGTASEMPVVADVDNDGQAEIVVTRNQFGNYGARTGTFNSGVFVYGDKWSNWVGTRRIWNQSGYYITNVDEDGGIPIRETPNWQIFNSFRQNEQFPREGTGGNPYAAPDLTASYIRLNESGLPDSVSVTARVGNGGGDVTPAGARIGFYDGEPESGGTLIGAATTAQSLVPGEYADVSIPFASPATGPHLITVVADDAGGPVLVESANLARLEGVTVRDYGNFSKTDLSIDGRAITQALGGSGSAWLEIGFPFPVSVASLQVVVGDAPGSTYYPTCTSHPVASLSLSNGFTAPLNMTCGYRGPEKLTTPAFYTGPFDLQAGITWLRLNFTTDAGSLGINVGDLVVPGSYYDPSGRRDAIAEGREDNNRAVLTASIGAAPPSGNLMPTIISSPVTAAVEGLPYTYDATALDLDSDPLAFSLLTRPDGMTIDSASGLVLWTPQSSQVGAHAVTLAVSDARGGTATQIYTLTVSALKSAPTFTSSPVLVAQAGILYIYDVDATDPEGTPIEYKLVDAPAGINIDVVSGLIRWLPSPNQVGSHAVTVQARDVGGDTMQQAFRIDVRSAINGIDLIVSQVNNLPSVTDLQSLVVSGQVEVTFGNAGDTDAPSDVEILLFADTDESGSYSAGIDTILGTAIYRGGLPAGRYETLTIAVSGRVSFRDDLIFAYVDSTSQVAEADEENNLKHSGESSELHVPTNDYTLAVEKIIPLANSTLFHAPLVANLTDDNGDGQIGEDDSPEVIVTDAGAAMRAYRVDTGALLWSWSRGTQFEYHYYEGSIPAVGDIDGDGKPDIAILHVNRDRIIVYTNEGKPKISGKAWTTPLPAKSAASIANIDHQGSAEIIVGNAIVNGDGTVRCKGSGSTGYVSDYNISTPVDLDLQGDMEVVAGNTAYRSDCTILWQNSSVPDGWTIAANLDADAYPEIIVVNTNRMWVLEHDGTLKAGPVTPPGGTLYGTPTVADFDGDGLAEIGAGGTEYAVYQGDLTMEWKTCCGFAQASAFDFEGDGRSEILSSNLNSSGGEWFFFIRRGTDGALLARYNVRPGAGAFAYPVTVDVDRDGNAEVLVPTAEGILVIGDRFNRWAGTRPIWNQINYHPQDVNDDGSIPQQELAFGPGHNSVKENPSFKGSPDLTASLIQVNQDSCPGTVTISARVGNGGAILAPAGVPVAFYDSFNGEASRIVGTSYTASSLAPGKYEDVSLALQTPAPGIHTLSAVADLRLTGSNLTWLPGTTAIGSSSVNGVPASELIDGSIYFEWCAASTPVSIDITLPYAADLSSVRFWADAPTSKKFTNGTLLLSNGYSLPVTFNSAGEGTFSFPVQAGVTGVRFTSTESSCLSEIEVAGTLTAVPSLDAPVAQVDAALVSHWPLDGSAVDSSSGGNNGIVFGNPQVVAGIASQALQFDGNRDFIMLSPYAAMPLSGLSVGLWIRTDDTTRQGTLFTYATDRAVLSAGEELGLMDYGNLRFCRYNGCAPAERGRRQ